MSKIISREIYLKKSYYVIFKNYFSNILQIMVVVTIRVDFMGRCITDCSHNQPARRVQTHRVCFYFISIARHANESCARRQSERVKSRRCRHLPQQPRPGDDTPIDWCPLSLSRGCIANCSRCHRTENKRRREHTLNAYTKNNDNSARSRKNLIKVRDEKVKREGGKRRDV